MGFYIITFLISLVFMYKYHKTSKMKFFIFSVIPVILLSGFRYDVGTDYMFRYFPDFKSIEEGIMPYNLEVGYLIIVRLCLAVSNNFQLVMIVTSVFIYGLLYYLIIKKSVAFEISIIVFFLGGFYFDSLNIVRQYMAIIMLLFCFYSLANDKIKRSIVFLLLAMTLHNTALIFVFVYIPVILKYNIKYITTILGFGLMITPICKPIMQLLLSGTRFNVYFEGKLSYYTEGDIQTVLCILNVAVLMTYLYITYRNKKILQEKIAILYIHTQAMAVILNVFTGFMFIAFRFTYMFSILQVFAIPYFLQKMGNTKTREKAIVILVVVYVSCLMYLSVLVGANEVIPYNARFYVN